MDGRIRPEPPVPTEPQINRGPFEVAREAGIFKRLGFKLFHMKLVKFKAGTSSVPVFINPDAVASVQNDPNSKLTLINTQDGKGHLVQESLDDVVQALEALPQ